jgi:asparagine synthase (glutamine-hydrolysing)
MCGIFGVLTVNQPAAQLQVERALAAVVHRGPDGEGIWRRAHGGPPFVAFGHRRLAIIDLSDSAAQPMESRDGAVCLTYNGEIYNYRELREELESAGFAFRSTGDTEVLLNAYRHWGPACLSRLNGMFAFCLWDETRRELFGARDRFGEKPFHYCYDECRGFFAFASEIKSLLASGLVPWNINDRALARYVTDNILDGHAETLYDPVKRLLPGRSLRLKWRPDGTTIEINRYWAPPAPGATEADPGRATARFRELFQDSVRLRLRSDVPIGTSLSGGVDSSAIVCAIHQLGAAGGQRTFSSRVPGSRLDEGTYIDIVRTNTGIGGYDVVPSAAELTRTFSILCRHMEEPFPSTSMFAQFLVMRLAQETHVSVLLDGQGADELLGGYHGYFRLRYGDMARKLKVGALRRELDVYSRLRGGRRALTPKGLVGALLPRRIESALSGRRASRGLFGDWWDRDWMASIDAGDAAVTKNLPHFDRFTAALYYDSLEGPLQELLRYGDRNSMAWSREVRQPFLDHRLAEYSFALAPELKISGGMTKVVLRRAMRGLVPDAVLDRPEKFAFETPQGHWLSGQLRPWVEEQLEKTASVCNGRLAAGIETSFRALRHPLREWDDAVGVFRLMTLGECLEQMKEQHLVDSVISPTVAITESRAPITAQSAVAIATSSIDSQ